MVARAQQRDHHGTDGGHAGGEAHRALGLLHERDLGLEGRGGGVALPAVDMAGLLALEDGGQVTRGGVAEGDRGVHRLVDRAMLDRRLPIGMQHGGGQSPGQGERSGGKTRNGTTSGCSRHLPDGRPGAAGVPGCAAQARRQPATGAISRSSRRAPRSCGSRADSPRATCAASRQRWTAWHRSRRRP